jgi:hypothetical protein
MAIGTVRSLVLGKGGALMLIAVDLWKLSQ